MPPISCGFRYRIARNDDEPFLWTVLYHGIHVPDGQAPPPLEIVQCPELARYVLAWSPETEPGVVAEVAGGTRLGAAWVRLLQGDQAGYGYVADDIPELGIAVLPPWRGLGVGTAMLQRLLQVVDVRYRGVSLSVNRMNRAQRLYQRLGFRAVASSDGTLVMLRDSHAGPAARME